MVENLKGGKPHGGNSNLDGEVQFLQTHRWWSSKSYGIYVAKLALPKKVLERSSELLDTFEGHQETQLS